MEAIDGASGVITTLLIEGIKWIVRKIAGKPDYDLPTLFYTISIPVINALMPFLFFWLGFKTTDPIVSMTLPDVGRYILLVAFSSFVSVAGYQQVVSPLKEYSRKLKALE
jgi:hypothetical protein